MINDGRYTVSDRMRCDSRVDIAAVRRSLSVDSQSTMSSLLATVTVVGRRRRPPVSRRM